MDELAIADVDVEMWDVCDELELCRVEDLVAALAGVAGLMTPPSIPPLSVSLDVEVLDVEGVSPLSEESLLEPEGGTSPLRGRASLGSESSSSPEKPERRRLVIHIGCLEPCVWSLSMVGLPMAGRAALDQSAFQTGLPTTKGSSNSDANKRVDARFTQLIRMIVRLPAADMNQKQRKIVTSVRP